MDNRLTEVSIPDPDTIPRAWWDAVMAIVNGEIARYENGTDAECDTVTAVLSAIRKVMLRLESRGKDD